MIKGFSLFSGGGIAETYFEEIGIHITVANELLPETEVLRKILGFSLSLATHVFLMSYILLLC